MRQRNIRKGSPQEAPDLMMRDLSIKMIFLRIRKKGQGERIKEKRKMFNELGQGHSRCTREVGRGADFDGGGRASLRLPGGLVGW